jgi:hypothetical protein
MDVTAISSTGYTRTPVNATGADATTNGADPSVEAATATGAKTNGAPYMSPVYKFDPVAQLDVLTFRNTSTGDVTVQYPAEKVVEQYRRNHGEPPSSSGSSSGTTTPATQGGTSSASATQTASTSTVSAGGKSGSGGNANSGSAGSGAGTGTGGWSSAGAGTGAWLSTGTGTGTGTTEVARVSLQV